MSATRRRWLTQAARMAGVLSSAAVAVNCSRLVETTTTRTGQPVRLQLWTFPVTHYHYFQEVAGVWQQKAGIIVEPSLIASDPGGQSWADKYQVAIAGGNAPDIADIEQGTFGRFLRGEVPMV